MMCICCFFDFILVTYIIHVNNWKCEYKNGKQIEGEEDFSIIFSHIELFQKSK